MIFQEALGKRKLDFFDFDSNSQNKVGSSLQLNRNEWQHIINTLKEVI